MSLHKLKKYIDYFTYYSWLNLKIIAELTVSSKAAFARGVPRLKLYSIHVIMLKKHLHLVQCVQ